MIGINFGGIRRSCRQMSGCPWANRDQISSLLFRPAFHEIIRGLESLRCCAPFITRCVIQSSCSWPERAFQASLFSFRSSRSSVLIVASAPSDPNKSSPWAASVVMLLRSILQIQLLTLPWRAWKKSRRATQDLPGLEESRFSRGNLICGTASKASQSMSHSRKVSLQRLQLGPCMQVSCCQWWYGGGSVGPGSSGLVSAGRRWPAIMLVSLSSESYPCMKRLKRRRMFRNEQYVPE